MFSDPLDRPLGAFLDDLAGEDAAPGGGSAAAITAAMAAGLAASVARLSAASWEGAGGAVAQAEALRLRVGPLVELDARAYDEALRTLAKRDQIAEPERNERIGEALERAADVLLRIAEAAADAAELAALVAEEGEHAIRADAAAAVILAEAAARTAASLVEINLTTTEEDPRIARARELLSLAEAARERAVAAAGS